MDLSYDILILYASQTGTSQYLAEGLFRDCFRHNLIPRIQSIDQYPISNLPSEKYIIFLISTTGQGEPPTSMTSFWQFLLVKDLPNDVLSETNFTIFGLGDSVYQQFNAMARKLYQRLLQLGARSFHERGLGDDSNALGHYAEFDPWTEALWKSLQGEFKGKKIVLGEEENKKIEGEIEKCRYLVEVLEEETKKIDLSLLTEGKNSENSNEENLSKQECAPTMKETQVKLLKRTELTSQDNPQRVVYLQFEIPSSLEYVPGDVACIKPRNDPELCLKLAELMGLNIEHYIKISENPYFFGQIQRKLPEVIKIKDLFDIYLDISNYPTRYFFKILSYFTKDELHREKLEEMGNGKKAENIKDYYDYCVKERRNVYEILYDFQSVKLPLEYLIESVNLMQHREYSISSSLKKQKNQFALTLALVNYKTPFGRNIEGICSGFFKRLEINQNVSMWVKKGTLIFPEKFTDPIIMVGPGTGISPFIGFLEEREVQIDEFLKENKENKKIDPLKTVVVFGCRYQKKDFLFEEYLKKLSEKGYITLITAFSRDQERKIYVQHKIHENGKIFGDLIEENNEKIKIFVSGNAKYMPQQVKEAFVGVIRARINDEQAAQMIMAKFQRKKQFVMEAW